MMKKTMSLLVLAALLVSTVTGCGGNDTASSAAGGSQSAAGSSAAAENEDGEAADDKSENVNIHIFGSFWPAEQNELTLYLLDQMEQKNNVTIELEVPPQSSYSESLQMMLAGGDYPDVVNFSSHTDKMFTQGVDSGLFVPITAEIQNAPNLLAHTYDVTWEAVKTKQDDDIYMIPRTTVVRNDGWVLRQDWLDNLGITLPEDLVVTKEEFFDIMKQFTENDPDGNGKNDTYGLVPSPSSDGYLSPIAVGAFDCYGWQESGGEFDYMDPSLELGNENYKAALQFTQDLWTAGYILPDWPILKSGDDGQRLYAGEAGCNIVFGGHVAIRETETKKLNPDAEMTYLAGISNSEGELLGSSNGAGIWGGWAVTSVCENKQRVVDLFDWLLSDEGWRIINYGEEGLTYNMEGDTPVVIPEAYKELKNNSWGQIFVRRCDDPTFFLDLSLPQEELDTASEWIQISMDTVVFSKDMGFRPAIADDAAFIEAENKRKEIVTKIIMGELPVDDYDAALTDWYAKGGQTYVEQMNEYIASRE